MSQEQTASSAPASVECGFAGEPAIRWAVPTALALGFGIYSIYEWATGKFDRAVQPTTWYFTVGCALLLPPVGLALLGVLVVRLRRRLVADGEGIGYAGRQKVGWDQVTRLVLRGKGLVDLHYQADGRDEVMTLDSYYLKNYDALMALVDARTEGKPVEDARKAKA
ncbi:MAG: hypothetical protein GX591_17895 [Planctomycetes bacterium]|nr:hypothetical protein [Planctomycetota bacterium]